MKSESVRFTWVQYCLFIPITFIVVLVGMFLSDYFGFGIAATTTWLILSMLAMLSVFVLVDGRQPLESKQSMRKALWFSFTVLLLLAFTHTPFFYGMKQGWTEMTERSAAATTSNAPETCKTKAQCGAEKYESLASSKCRSELEKQVIAVRWTEYNILSTYADDKEHLNRITYYGDAGEFQLEPGPYQQWTYFCNFDYERAVVMDSGLLVPGVIN
jgi:hypothetical protein